MIVGTAPELCQNVIFPEKGMKEMFAYVLEFMLTLAQMLGIGHSKVELDSLSWLGIGRYDVDMASY